MDQRVSMNQIQCMHPGLQLHQGCSVYGRRCDGRRFEPVANSINCKHCARKSHHSELGDRQAKSFTARTVTVTLAAVMIERTHATDSRQSASSLLPVAECGHSRKGVHASQHDVSTKSHPHSVQESLPPANSRRSNWQGVGGMDRVGAQQACHLAPL